ncbi:BA75_05080T0 [Komagataella pastoris]|uniref:Vacuolar protein sorting-associated protein 28 n=1 Tax=Komagataella pastoris TaxID=4922 RepID=A0A1B2JI73_PICPA|nr:BA75_05080T0 [Komagataella pastoris]
MNNQSPYAPTNIHSGRSVSLGLVRNSSISLDVPFKLYENSKEQHLYEALSELYSIIVTLNSLERAFIKDTLSDNYEVRVNRLISQYNAILKQEEVLNLFGSLEQFTSTYQLDAPYAKNRLEVGLPLQEPQLTYNGTGSGNGIGSTAELGNGAGAGTGSNYSSRAVAEATGNFITCMDAIKLHYRTKEQLHPLFSDLIMSINKVLNNGEFDGKAKIVEWLIKLNGLGIDESISEQESKTLLFDLDNSYKGFYSKLDS